MQRDLHSSQALDLESHLQNQQRLLRSCSVKAVTASTYEIPYEELDLESYVIIDALYDASFHDSEFDDMVEVVRHMLHPDARMRASVAQALQSPVFVDSSVLLLQGEMAKRLNSMSECKFCWPAEHDTKFLCCLLCFQSTTC